MLLVYLVEPDPERERELREALHRLPCGVQIQESQDGRWVVRIECTGWEAIREDLLILGRRFPSLVGLGRPSTLSRPHADEAARAGVVAPRDDGRM